MSFGTGLACWRMKSYPEGTRIGEKAPSQGGTVERERRRTPRYVFFASAELYEEKSEVRVASRLSELSLHGCYLDMMNPFPVDTIILLKISSGETLFAAKGRIIYSQPNMGAGVVFLEVEPQYQAVLGHWLEEAAKEK
jgi:hypothetical protein